MKDDGVSEIGTKLTQVDHEGELPGSPAENDSHKVSNEIIVERYRYILGQIRSTNENAYKVITIWQTLVTFVVGGEVGLFINWKRWGIDLDTVRAGLLSLAILASLVSVFSLLLILIGVVNWFHYRLEEKSISDNFVYPDFRSIPHLKNMFKWIETYVASFVVLATVGIWTLTELFLIPKIG